MTIYVCRPTRATGAGRDPACPGRSDRRNRLTNRTAWRDLRCSGGPVAPSPSLTLTSTTFAVVLGAAAGAKSNTVKVDINDDGCPAKLKIKAGPTTFKVTNTGSGDVSEFEMLSGDRIIGEVENVAPGLNREFSLTLKPGDVHDQVPGRLGARHRQARGHRDRGHQAVGRGQGRGRPVPPVPRGADRGARHRDQGVHRRGRPRQRRAGQGAVRAVPRRLRAHRAGGRDLRRPRPGDRRPRG